VFEYICIIMYACIDILYFLQKTNTLDSNVLLSYLDYARSLRPQNLAHFIESYVRYMCLCFYFVWAQNRMFVCFTICVPLLAIVSSMVQSFRSLICSWHMTLYKCLLIFWFWRRCICTGVWFKLLHIVLSARPSRELLIQFQVAECVLLSGIFNG